MYQALTALHQLHDGYRQVFRIQGRELLLLQEDGLPRLLVNRCPHMDAPLHRASVEQGVLRCPAHGLSFDLASGRCLNGPAGCVGPLEQVPLVYEGNTLGLDL